MTSTPTIETAVTALNSAFAADPAAIHALLVNRVPCNQVLADHPTVQVAVNPVLGDAQYTVGLLGLLNGVLEPITGRRVAAQWDEPAGPGQPARLLGFCVYEPAQPEDHS